jgi:valyl-tRNA synthetase
LSKELAEAERMLAETEARLANESFVKRAPGPIVQAARDRLIELEARVERLRARLSA